ncbi:MAG: hypothetical protein WCQ99_01385 [Pseudomonadota bacterium]
MAKRSAFIFAVFLIFLWVGNARAGEHVEIEQRFNSYCQKWIDALNKYSKAHISCSKVNDEFVAQYLAYNTDFEITVKKTDAAKASYIGILKHKETKYQGKAQTCEGALLGPFAVAYEYPVTEIFLYSNGSWER